jgi:hypothetical protein
MTRRAQSAEDEPHIRNTLHQRLELRDTRVRASTSEAQ